MKTQQIINALGALAHEHRLSIFRLLMVRGPEGLSAGHIAERMGLIPSSLTFHLQNLHRAELITQRREGRQLFYSADFAAMNALLAYLTENCCVESSTDCVVDCQPVRPAKSSRRAIKVA